MTADGVGEWATTTVAIGKKNNLEIKKEIHFPHSLGLLYSAFTYYIGFKVNSGEYKLMGLAPYGVPSYVDKIKNNLIDIKEDGSFRLIQKFFEYSTGLEMINSNFIKLFGQQKRNPKEKITQFHMDIAASIQNVTEEIMLKITKSLKDEYNINNLCLAGGVALNCVANGKILKEKILIIFGFNQHLETQVVRWVLLLLIGIWKKKNKRKLNLDDDMQGSYLGPKYSNNEIEKSLDKIGAKFEVFDDEELLDITANYLSKGLAIGWFQGRAEFGPRALGARSILADPRSTNMQKNLNLKVKFRESFRPFAPSILSEESENWFKPNVENPYMLIVSEISGEKRIEMNEDEKKLFGIDKLNIKRSSIPAVTHVDYSARIQTVNKKNNLMFYNLIKKFYDKTNCPVLVNTSFNIRGQPIVNSPEDAFNCFMGTGLDILVIGNLILKKDDQNVKFNKNFKEEFDPD